jgi:predicted metal-dependent HD superfamily phosphohydrolase
MLRDTYVQLVLKYSKDDQKVNGYWSEIATKHSTSVRYYHNLSHLENLVNQLSLVKQDITDWNTVLFSVFYHDIVYSATQKDNEEKSAQLAAARLKALAVPPLQIEKCVAQILATKSHQLSDDPDTNLFTDADLSILGMEWPLYEAYYKQVRQEYSIYPNREYKPGRKKVLQHFLDMEKIFKTDQFFSKYEVSARENLARELMTLE